MRLAPLTVLTLAVACGRTAPLTPRAGFEGDGGPDTSCVVVAEPAAVDFGVVPLGSTETRTVSLENVGARDCLLALSIGAAGDAEFSVRSRSLEIPAGHTVVVGATFAAQSRSLPRERAADLVVDFHDDVYAGTTSVKLTASIAIGCELGATPDPVDFGSVLLNTSASATLTLSNSGTSPCDVTGIALSPATDQLFSIATTLTSFTVAPGEIAAIPLAFSGADSTEPHARSGGLDFVVSQPSGLPLNPSTSVEVPLKAFINTECMAGSQWIYTIDSNRMLSLFNPLARSFTDIGPLDCPDDTGTFSMAVDQQAVAWVEYMSGELYRVDTTTAACSTTTFQVNPNLTNFGMGFVYQPDPGVDTLFVAGGDVGAFPTSAKLATIAFPSLALTYVAPLDFGAAELTGTGDGQLWGLAPAESSATGVTTLARIDPKTGVRLVTLQYPTIGNGTVSWALKFWGGSFYLFLGDSIYEVPRSTGELKVAIEHTGRSIVGAGVSTCAPLQ